MADLVFVVLTVALFLGLTALVTGLDRAVAPDPVPTRPTPPASPDGSPVADGAAAQSPSARASAR